MPASATSRTPRPPKAIVSIYASPELLRRAARAAKREGKSRNQFICDAVEERAVAVLAGSDERVAGTR